MSQNKLTENMQEGYHPVKGDTMLCKLCGRKINVTTSGKGPLVCCGQPMSKVGEYSESQKMNLVDAYLETIYEELHKAKRTSITKVTRQTKIDRAIGALATKYAKDTNDPLYHKMTRFRDKFFKYREMIRRKFGPRVRSRAISGKGIADMIRAKKEGGSQTGKASEK